MSVENEIESSCHFALWFPLYILNEECLSMSLFDEWPVSWDHLVSATKHELFPMMSTAMGSVVTTLCDDEKFDKKDLGKEAVEKVIEGMKKNRKMRASQVAYIENMVLRASEYQKS